MNTPHRAQREARRQRGMKRRRRAKTAGKETHRTEDKPEYERGAKDKGSYTGTSDWKDSTKKKKGKNGAQRHNKKGT